VRQHRRRSGLLPQALPLWASCGQPKASPYNRLPHDEANDALPALIWLHLARWRALRRQHALQPHLLTTARTNWPQACSRLNSLVLCGQQFDVALLEDQLGALKAQIDEPTTP
jgi:hypothetical protein